MEIRLKIIEKKWKYIFLTFKETSKFFFNSISLYTPANDEQNLRIILCKQIYKIKPKLISQRHRVFKLCEYMNSVWENRTFEQDP